MKSFVIWLFDSFLESESESQHESVISSTEVSSLVRKELAVAIRDLMHHGLISGAGRNVVGSIVPFMGCMSSKNTSATASSKGGGRSLIHAWDIVLKFYSLKLGHEYNAAPARKLSQSFGLDLSGSSSGNKQSLLATIGCLTTSGMLFDLHTFSWKMKMEQEPFWHRAHMSWGTRSPKRSSFLHNLLPRIKLRFKLPHFRSQP